jgi:hypothetical protein
VIERQDVGTRFIEIGFEANHDSNLHFLGRKRKPSGWTMASKTTSGDYPRMPDGFEKSASLNTGSSVFC